jgi:hypothetical protein
MGSSGESNGANAASGTAAASGLRRSLDEHAEDQAHISVDDLGMLI